MGTYLLGFALLNRATHVCVSDMSKQNCLDQVVKIAITRVGTSATKT